MTLLWIIAAVLLVTVLARLMTVVNLASEITKEDNDDTQIKHNTYNGVGFIIFMVAGLGLMVYMTLRYSKYMLPEAASAHGPGLDMLLNVNFLIIAIVFFITQIVLFWFAHKYRHNHSRRAYFYPENHKLELVWTVVPAIVLTVLIVTGLKQWNDILMTEKKGMNVQLYGYQFAFIARYSGEDNTLGKSNFRLINDENALGLNLDDKATKDDIVTTGNEMHLPVGTSINFTFNARDVLHGAYMPHFRAQMNMVPGMNTHFNFTPTITTKEMRSKLKKDNFDYVLLCNKICGNAHYTMKMKIVVDTPEEFAAWLKTQKKASEIPAANAAEVKVADAAPTNIKPAANL